MARKATLKRQNFRKLDHGEWHEIHTAVNTLAELVTRKNYKRRIRYTREEVLQLVQAREHLARLVKGTDYYLQTLVPNFNRGGDKLMEIQAPW
jgi:hypothetical protein